ncbi:hypothetical protein Ptr902_01419 [Pyrenophora tritici-repentis]|nr:hypothetical protein Ptr902_01419 [Pyrenophora tritici-repentis]
MVGGADAPNSKISIRNDSNTRAVAATKKGRSQLDQLGIQERTVKRGLTVAYSGRSIGSAKCAGLVPVISDMAASAISESCQDAATPDIFASSSSPAKSLLFGHTNKRQHSSSPLSSLLSPVLPASTSEARRCERKARANFLEAQKEMLEGDILRKRKKMERLEDVVACRQRRLERINERMRVLSEASEDSAMEDSSDDDDY